LFEGYSEHSGNGCAPWASSLSNIFTHTNRLEESMMSQRLSLSFALLVHLVAQAAIAQTATVEVTIQAVKSEAKEITVAYMAGTEGKTITLDVSRKAEITVNGEAGTLDALKPGQKAIPPAGNGCRTGFVRCWRSGCGSRFER